MALFGEKYGETVRTITIMPSTFDMSVEETNVHPSAMVEHEHKYSYELCGGTHLDRTSDVGAFIIISEGSAAAGVRRIEAVTGRGAYDVIVRRFKMLKQAAATLKTSVDEVPRKVESLQDEIADLKKQLTAMRNEMAHSKFSGQAENIQIVGDVRVLAMEVPNAEANTLRSLADKFREKYPKKSIAVLASGSTVISAVANDLVALGIKAGDLITAIGGKGGGRPNLAQGSLPDGNVNEALSKVAKTVEEKLK